MKKIAALVIMTVGLVCMIYSGFQIWKGRELQASALHQAKAITKEIGNSTKIIEKTQTKHVNVTDKNIIGLLTIPRLKEELPIVEGTLPDQLAKGVGHYETSALPGSNNQIVLSGHRDTVFQRFGELKKGDEITVKLKNGTFTYIIDHLKIVEADDRTIIHPTKPVEELVLTTCYPFHYIGNAPKRYIIYAYPKTS